MLVSTTYKKVGTVKQYFFVSIKFVWYFRFRLASQMWHFVTLCATQSCPTECHIFLTLILLNTKFKTYMGVIHKLFLCFVDPDFLLVTLMQWRNKILFYVASLFTNSSLAKEELVRIKERSLNSFREVLNGINIPI